MPQFNLLGMNVAKYVNTSGAITYTNRQKIGDAMACNLELRFAEARLYAEGALAEYLRECIGGTISVGVKYIKEAAQKLMYGSTEKSRSITYTPDAGGSSVTASVVGLVTSAKDSGDYVGFACYAPDMIDGVKKYTAFFISKVRFGPPSYSLQTKGQTINFATPTTSGEFMADDSSGKAIQEIAVLDDENAAIAWCEAVLT